MGAINHKPTPFDTILFGYDTIVQEDNYLNYNNICISVMNHKYIIYHDK